jgi:hypothetical protein
VAGGDRCRGDGTPPPRHRRCRDRLEGRHPPR